MALTDQQQAKLDSARSALDALLDAIAGAEKRTTSLDELRAALAAFDAAVAAAEDEGVSMTCSCTEGGATREIRAGQTCCRPVIEQDCEFPNTLQTCTGNNGWTGRCIPCGPDE